MKNKKTYMSLRDRVMKIISSAMGDFKMNNKQYDDAILGLENLIEKIMSIKVVEWNNAERLAKSLVINKIDEAIMWLKTAKFA